MPVTPCPNPLSPSAKPTSRWDSLFARHWARSPILHLGEVEFHRPATRRGSRLVGMGDVWVVLGIIGFTAAMLWLVHGLERV